MARREALKPREAISVQGKWMAENSVASEESTVEEPAGKKPSRMVVTVIAAILIVAVLVIAVVLSPKYSPLASIHDADGDGVADSDDEFPDDCDEWCDTDGDGCGDNGDAFPLDPSETSDADGDGYGDNCDEFPLDPDEWEDSDGDGYGDNSDAFPDDPEEWLDTDDDGVGDNSDEFPNDPDEWQDSDGDGYGDNCDAFPEDETEWADSDGDGIGDNSDTDYPPVIAITGRVIISSPAGYKFTMTSPTSEVTWTDLTIVLQSGEDSYAWSNATEEGLTGTVVTTQALGPSCDIGGVTFWLNITDLAGNGLMSNGDYFTLTGTFTPGTSYTVTLIHEPTDGQMAHMTWTA